VASLRPNGIKPLVRFEVEGLPGCQHDFGQVDVHFSQGYIRFSAAKDETVNSLVRREEGLYCFQLSQLPSFLSLMAEPQQSHPSQQCLPVSPLDIESAPKKQHQ
jgi:hypothetical protein